MKKERYLIFVTSKLFGWDMLQEKYFWKVGPKGPIGTSNLKLARKWDRQSEAFHFCQALIKHDGWQRAYVGTA